MFDAKLTDDLPTHLCKRTDMMNDPNLTPSEHADNFVALIARTFGTDLDYTVESIDIVDHLLQAYVGDCHLDDTADRALVVGAGCYVGEILIREKLAERWVDIKEIHFPGKGMDSSFDMVLCCKKAHGSIIHEGEKWEQYFFLQPVATAINICKGMKTTMRHLYRRMSTIHLCPGSEQAPKPGLN
jgi:hypothetical protein